MPSTAASAICPPACCVGLSANRFMRGS
jgi:hypothetical protein